MTALSAGTEMTGQRLLGVTASLHEYAGITSKEPVHVWLRLDRSGYLQCLTAGNGNLTLRSEKPYATYDMQEHGRVLLVQGQPRSLATHTGEVIEAVTVLDQQPPGMAVGLLLTFQSGAVAVANLGDELVVGVWPDAFKDLGVQARKQG